MTKPGGLLTTWRSMLGFLPFSAAPRRAGCHLQSPFLPKPTSHGTHQLHVYEQKPRGKKDAAHSESASFTLVPAGPKWKLSFKLERAGSFSSLRYCLIHRVLITETQVQLSRPPSLLLYFQDKQESHSKGELCSQKGNSSPRPSFLQQQSRDAQKRK